MRVALRLLLRRRLGGIELQQQVSRLHALPVLDMDGDDLARVERLDHLGVPGRIDLAGRHRVHVEPAEKRPGERGREEGADHEHRHDGQRRRRHLQNLDRRRQEFAVAARHGRRKSGGRLGRGRRRRGSPVHAALRA